MSYNQNLNLWERLDLTPELLAEIINENSTVQGMLFGYAAEYNARDLIKPLVSKIKKINDQKRGQTGDWSITYQQQIIKMEVRCIHEADAKRHIGINMHQAIVPLDVSSKRELTLPNSNITLRTVNVLRDHYDVLCVGCFHIYHKRSFAFILTKDIPSLSNSKDKELKPYQHLFLPTTIKINFPLKPPYYDDPIKAFDALLHHRANPPSINELLDSKDTFRL
jgi:hypothetical protein